MKKIFFLLQLAMLVVFASCSREDPDPIPQPATEVENTIFVYMPWSGVSETDSGLDVDAVRTVSAGIKEYQKKKDGALLIITHSTRILESLKVDYTHIMVDFTLIKEDFIFI